MRHNASLPEKQEDINEPNNQHLGGDKDQVGRQELQR